MVAGIYCSQLNHKTMQVIMFTGLWNAVISDFKEGSPLRESLDRDRRTFFGLNKKEREAAKKKAEEEEKKKKEGK